MTRPQVPRAPGVMAAFVAYYGRPTTTSASRGSILTDGNVSWDNKCQWATFLTKLHVALRMYGPLVDMADPAEFGTAIVEYVHTLDWDLKLESWEPDETKRAPQLRLH
eukprot:4025198-Prymnesium_polylepis.1